jgi:hypothetical protein
MAGWSTPTYSEGNFGSKGPFASGNGLALYLGSASLIALIRHRSTGQITALWEPIFLLTCCLLVGTKASIIFGFLFAGIMLQRMSFVWKLVVVTCTAAGILFFAEQITATFSLIFDVILFRFDASESLFAFIASGRDIYVTEALESFDASGWGLVRLFFGAGAFVSFRDIREGLTEYDTLESDFFDIFFAYGAFGLLCYIALIVWGIRLARGSQQLALLVVWVATCFYSAAAGHVAFNAMSGMVIPVMLIALKSRHLPHARENV